MDDETRPMMAKVSTEKLMEIFIANAHKLKFADEMFKGIILAHELPPRHELGLKKFTKVTLTATFLFCFCASVQDAPFD